MRAETPNSKGKCTVLNRTKQSKRIQYLSVSLVLVLLLLAIPVAAQTAGEGVRSYSGDDPYDPAAGGLPALSGAGFTQGTDFDLPCAPSDSELEARRSRSVPGGYSGDDPYDPAAGGTPELSLLAMGIDLVDCAPVISGN
jgi:hypothetical protein